MEQLSGLMPGTRLALGYLRIRGFDPSTEQGRAAERYRRAAWSTLTGVDDCQLYTDWAEMPGFGVVTMVIDNPTPGEAYEN